VTDPLEGARAKLARAEAHHEALGSEWQAYLNTDPYGMRLERDLREFTIWVFFQILKPIPVEIALVAGDAVQNLRASLDYVATELVASHGGNTGRAQFPISTTEKAFIDNVRSRPRGAGPLDCVPAISDAFAFIEHLQPYQRGRLAKRDPLYALQCLSNRDKHRSLTPAFGAPMIGMLGDVFAIESQQRAVYQWRYLWLPWNPLTDGALLGGVRFPFPPDRETVRMEARGPMRFDVFFDEGIERTSPDQPYGIRRLIEHARSIIDSAAILFR
jgi:hypothetical protein